MQTTSVTSHAGAVFALHSAATTRARRAAVVLGAARQDAPAISRRSLAALFAAAPLVTSPAWALIPDDDDEELVEKARANRKSRLASERATEKTFARTEGFVDSSEKKELAPIQRAVNSLGLAGKQLAAGEVAAAASTLNGSWADDFGKAAASLSGDVKAAKVVSQLASLQKAAGSGSLSGAKSGYVALVASLQSWAAEAGIAASLKGL